MDRKGEFFFGNWGLKLFQQRRGLAPERYKKFLAVILAAALGLALILGWTGVAAPQEKIVVAASIIPLGDFCQKIGGERIKVQVLVPPGASPHIFEPPPSVVAQALEAAVVVYVGAGLDPWVERLLRARGTRNMVVVEAVRAIPLLRQWNSHPHEQGNPHVWLDPVLAQRICQDIAQAFIRVDPDYRQQYKANLTSYLNKLAQLHHDILNEVTTFRRRAYVCFHPAFSYFARRYNLKEVGVIEIAPGREPSPRHIQNIIDAIRRYRVPVVFTEPQLSSRVAEVIAREAGVKVASLDPLGGRAPYGSDYLKMMRYNLSVMRRTLR
ncbi:MAG: zinc ABC transporter substrate-binding protein [Deltaproteobacteria bacterium]|nr:zinc ABC transporter substrate-binding protein [Deltaproteobacteria bacterium]MBW1952194.1 zinc ABC transporter substrate-binding protein [Deltaproteobacteria bacterium]MBW1985728.1 zinc ABC transporter substrate-binding protein [Deltaproteobacteria bacterium]MBW2134641.1 zinc ABC transporter substrate-binding protein [Deltaproteobacteria bacterium]